MTLLLFEINIPAIPIVNNNPRINVGIINTFAFGVVQNLKISREIIINITPKNKIIVPSNNSQSNQFCVC